jgi:hypothetical protein
MVLVMRDAGAHRDHPDMHVTIIDVPTVLAFRIAAAGEGGHAAIEARLMQTPMNDSDRPTLGAPKQAFERTCDALQRAFADARR